jgi:PAS domain S-box-containing protein
MIQGFLYILVNQWLHKFKHRDKLSQKNQKISDSDFDIGMNPFIRFVLQGLQGTIYFHDPVKDENLFLSKKVLDHCGYTKQEILALDPSIQSIIHNDDLLGVYEINEQVLKLKDGDFAEATYRANKKEGGWAWCRSEEYVYKRDELGNPTLIFGVAQDVTLVKEKEAQPQKNIGLESIFVRDSTIDDGWSRRYESHATNFDKETSGSVSSCLQHLFSQCAR